MPRETWRKLPPLRMAYAGLVVPAETIETDGGSRLRVRFGIALASEFEKVLGLLGDLKVPPCLLVVDTLDGAPVVRGFATVTRGDGGYWVWDAVVRTLPIHCNIGFCMKEGGHGCSCGCASCLLAERQAVVQNVLGYIEGRDGWVADGGVFWWTDKTEPIKSWVPPCPGCQGAMVYGFDTVGKKRYRCMVCQPR
jgi:hypothetical protein